MFIAHAMAGRTNYMLNIATLRDICFQGGGPLFFQLESLYSWGILAHGGKASLLMNTERVRIKRAHEYAVNHIDLLQSRYFPLRSFAPYVKPAMKRWYRSVIICAFLSCLFSPYSHRPYVTGLHVGW